MRKPFILAHDLARQRCLAAVRDAPAGAVVTIGEPTRSLVQNSALWPILDALSKQVDWYSNKLTSEEWKDVLTASLRGQKAVPGLDGGFVVLGRSTRIMSKTEFSDLIECALAFGASKGVEFPAEPIHPSEMVGQK